MSGFVSGNFGLVSAPRRSTSVCGRTVKAARIAVRPRMAETPEEGAEKAEETFPKLKEFLDATKPLGLFRFIATNDAAVMEAISATEKLFYATIPTGLEYANIIDPEINMDMHLKLVAVGGARFEQGVSRGPSKAPTYIIRMLGKDMKTVVLSMFLSGPNGPGDISEERAQAWLDLKEKYTGSDSDTAEF